MRRFAIAVSIFSALAVHAQPKDIDARVEKLLSQMTLEEKLGQLTQYVPDQPEFSPALAKGLVGSILNGGRPKEINALQRVQMANSRLKIPLLVGHDVIHGYRTIFPIPLAIASSWDPKMAELSSRVAAREARATGIRWTFAPMVDIARDPRWGRIAEGAGEDPVLGSAMAEGYVRGFQGTNPAATDSLLACAKHYVGYGAAEGGRDYGQAEMSERTLRDIYLPPFHAAVNAGVTTLMSAFESINGVPASANKHTLDDILRREWKFNGFVVSDWTAVEELIRHGVAATKQEAAIKAISAGVDMDMVDNTYVELAAAVRDGHLAQSIVDTSVRRVLRAKYLAGLFDNPFTDEALPEKVTLTAENRGAARRVAQRSIVLLRNEGNLLPLPKSGKTIAVIGALADSKTDILGPWAAEGKPEDTTSVLDGLRAIIPAIQFAKAGSVAGSSDAEIAAAVDLATHSDITIAILGEEREMSGEAASRSSIELPGNQQKLLEAIAATGKPVVLVLMSGRPLAIPWAALHIPAIVQSWFLGTEGGNAIADVLFGDVNPSGKLPVTIPRATGQVPIYYSQVRIGRPADAANKYTSKYIDLPLGPLYPFGFGLSYTKFDYSNLAMSASSMRIDGRITISADVHNTGGRDGDEIVQMYVSDPVASVSRPVKELKGFQRLSLKAGETKRVEFAIERKDVQFWGDNAVTAEPGNFTVWIGPSSATGLEGTFELIANHPLKKTTTRRLQ